MKATAAREPAASASPSSKPFFSKGEEGFFSGSREAGPAFFSPAVIQPKLTIGTPGDPYEQEADSVAARVVQRLNAPPVQRRPRPAVNLERRPGMEEEEEVTLAAPEPVYEKKAGSSAVQLQREHAATPSPGFTGRLQASRGQGASLPPSTRMQMESAFGSDFESVRIHTDAHAVQMSREIGARAFTTGSDIYFNQGEFSPQSSAGATLLAHELTHVIQQGGSIPVNYIQRDLAVEPPNPDAVGRELTEEEVASAIAFNRARFRNEAELSNLRDVLGLSPEPAVIDAGFIETVVQWQAENNQTQDGKIGPLMARIIGREMLAEADLDAGQRRPAIRMLERGIILSLSNNRYTDTATTSRKIIQFNVSIPPGLNMRDYALVNFVQGGFFFMPGPTSPTATMYGNPVPANFATEQVDSVDPDPIYWSTATSRWNYNVAGRTFTATDDPGRPTGLLNPGDRINLNFRIAVFRVRDLPATTTGDVGNARPLASASWRFSVLRDAASGDITHP